MLGLGMRTGWIYTRLERAISLNHLLGVESVSDCERSMALEWPAGFMKSSGSTTPKRGERPGPPGTPAHDAETQPSLLLERLFPSSYWAVPGFPSHALTCVFAERIQLRRYGVFAACRPQTESL